MCRTESYGPFTGCNILTVFSRVGRCATQQYHTSHWVVFFHHWMGSFINCEKQWLPCTVETLPSFPPLPQEPHFKAERLLRKTPEKWKSGKENWCWLFIPAEQPMQTLLQSWWRNRLALWVWVTVELLIFRSYLDRSQNSFGIHT